MSGCFAMDTIAGAMFVMEMDFHRHHHHHHRHRHHYICVFQHVGLFRHGHHSRGDVRHGDGRSSSPPSSSSSSLYVCFSMSGCFAMDTIAGAAFGMDVDSMANPDGPFNTNGRRLLDQNMWMFFLASEFLALARGISHQWKPQHPRVVTKVAGFQVPVCAFTVHKLQWSV